MENSLSTEGQLHIIQTICFQEKWSNRTQSKLIRVARTIADFAGEIEISEQSIQEAVSWKRLASSFHDTKTEMKAGR